MRVQNHIPIKAVAIKEEDGLEIGTEYDVEDIMMGAEQYERGAGRGKRNIQQYLIQIYAQWKRN